VLKHDRIRVTIIGVETFRATALRPKFSTFSRQAYKLTIRKLNSTIRVDSSSTHYRRTLCLKGRFIRLRVLGEEAFVVTLPRLAEHDPSRLPTCTVYVSGKYKLYGYTGVTDEFTWRELRLLRIWAVSGTMSTVLLSRMQIA